MSDKRDADASIQKARSSLCRSHAAYADHVARLRTWWISGKSVKTVFGYATTPSPRMHFRLALGFCWVTCDYMENFRLPWWQGVAFRSLPERRVSYVAPIPLNFLIGLCDRIYWRLRFPTEDSMKRKAMSIIALDRMQRGQQPRCCEKCGHDWMEE